MNQDLSRRAAGYSKRWWQRRSWKNLVSFLACVVVFCTTYALILPAITQEREVFCGMERHVHEQACYTQTEEIDRLELTCTYETLEVHEHLPECYDERGIAVCGQADYVLHTHDASCYREDGSFACLIPEIREHVHTDACYRSEGGHAHTEACYTSQRGEKVVCQLAEDAGHLHSDACYVQGALLCTAEENHIHTDACYTAAQLTCVSAEHTHESVCYTPDCLVCLYPEGHVHGEGCYLIDETPICGMEEHSHTSGCYGRGELLCSQSENHFHGETCYSARELICDPSDGHEHNDGCYSQPQLICHQTEGHLHTDDCYQPALTCQLPEHVHSQCHAPAQLICHEIENHIHTTECYQYVLQCETAEHAHGADCYSARELLCAEPEGHIHAAECYEHILQCAEPEREGHAHADECFENVLTLVCTLEETPAELVLACAPPAEHIHSETCYQPVYVHVLTCGSYAHEHDLACYSDDSADTESVSQWKRSFAHVKLSGVRENDIIAIAESQLGYRESTRNYIVLEDGETIRGYTRYGAWYGAPYSDWCAMFASFCLHYAGIEDVPLEAHCQKWIWALMEESLYREAEEYQPKSGDLIFFDFDEDDRADHVGIVAEIDEKFKVIEGNSADCVRYVDYEKDDECIMGYGMIPEILNQNTQTENPENTEKLPEESADETATEYLCGLKEHAHASDCFSEAGDLLCVFVEHAHDETCLTAKTEEEIVVPEYICGVEEHSHAETCCDEAGNLICGLPEHAHDETCLTAKTEEEIVVSEYICGMEEHTHAETCYDEAGNLICELFEHVHDETCIAESEGEPHPEYICGMEEHSHAETCYDEAGNLICELPEHAHDETCLTAKTEEEIVVPEYICGMEEHTHAETCYDEAGNLICELPEHTHEAACIAVEYICGMEEHTHAEICYDEAGNLICELSEHVHDETCIAASEGELHPEYICSMEEHSHAENCYDEAGNLICELPEHTHEAACIAVEHICGMEEHSHAETCYDEAGNLICELSEHVHDETCIAASEDEVHPEYICGMEEHSHAETCYDEAGNLICELPEHVHDETCIAASEDEVHPEYICGMEEHTHAEICYDEAGNLICELPEHIHDETCIAASEDEVHPEYICGMEEHSHAEICYDEAGNLICELPEHVHDETCITESEGELHPEYICGMEEHIHAEICYDEAGNLICELPEHVHNETCIAESEGELHPEYICGMEEHSHAETCYDEAGNLICELPEHVHDETCIAASEDEVHPEYICGMEEHTHAETCYDEAGNLICELPEHTHEAACIAVEYICGMEEHSHAETCYDEAGNLICELPEHTHEAACIAVEYICGMEEHTHAETCYDEAGNLICELPEHVHDESCMPIDRAIPYFCGIDEHTHTEECFDEAGAPICGMEEHMHSMACEVDLTMLNDDLRRQVMEIILLIEELPTYEMLDEKIQEYEAIGDYAAQEIWMMQLYEQVQRVYRRYAALPAEAQDLIPNRERLLNLDFIWAIMPLVDTVVAYTTPYTEDMFASNASFVVYTQKDGAYYAFDGNGNAVPLTIDPDGSIVANVDNKNILLWSFVRQNNGSYSIRNLSTRRYMHAYPNNGSGVTTTTNYPSVLVPSGNGVKIRSNTEYARLRADNRGFEVTSSQAQAAEYQFGVLYNNYVWLDGTNGGLRSLEGSPDKAYQVTSPTFILPETWDSPEKYAYKLRGWYDVINDAYYAPGAAVQVSENMVFYADWVAASYDIGQFNAKVSDTVSTNEFVTTRVFDYSSIFNTLSTTASVTVSADSHSETWSMSSDADSPNFVFRDWDGQSQMSYPNGSQNGTNNTNNSNGATSGLYSRELVNLLFGTTAFDPATDTGVRGRQYLGTGDHLFQYGTNPAEPEHYGYYYYDSYYNAASYNRSAQRFYVYEYLERTSDSLGNNSYSDFLPFNSPYANTNGNTVRTYTYNGPSGEYEGTTHYMYDAKYTGDGDSASNVGTNYWFGLHTELKFYLPNKPGTRDSEGQLANQSLFGQDMIFEFDGDDDVWVLVDGRLVLDLGGIHGEVGGNIDFSTGDVYVQDRRTGDVTYLEPGEHTLTIYYLERGSSLSNCKIRFNLSPRFSLSVQKEDVLTRELLNGAEFSVYLDEECTVPAQLWTSQRSHDRGDEPTNLFAVENGHATMWGLASGHTYYMKETKPPGNRTETVHGIVVMKLNNKGTASYDIMKDHGELSGGFTAHGYRIDSETQEAFLVISNSEPTDDVTSITVTKRWNDNANHSGDSVTVYLVVDGKRIREEVLSDENNWTFTWSNMPKYYPGTEDEVEYLVAEGTVPGYTSRITRLTEQPGAGGGWVEAQSLTDGAVHLFRSGNGYLAASGNRLYWIANEADAKASPNARWVATWNAGAYAYNIQNEAGQILYICWYPSGFRAGSSVSNGSSTLTFSSGKISHFNNPLMGAVNAGDGTAAAVEQENQSQAISFTLYREDASAAPPEPVEGFAYQITNTPVSPNDVMSLKVVKEWNLGMHGTPEMYEQMSITVKLLMNGTDSGISRQISLKNGWSVTFNDLSKKDSYGNDIVYTVVEDGLTGPWSPQYGEVTAINGSQNAFETTITNVNTLIYMLPETGGAGTNLYMTTGLLLIAAALILLAYKTKFTAGKEESNSS